MKDYKAKELRSKTEADLNEMLAQEHASMFKARRDLVFRRINDVAGLKVRRHNVARILTVLAEKAKESK